MDSVQLSSYIQILCVVLLNLEYGSQLWKLYKTKHAKDISLIFWVTKISIATMQVISLFLVEANLMSFISQIIGIIFSVAVLMTTIYYNQKAKRN